MDEDDKLEDDVNQVKQGKQQAQQSKSQMADMGKDLAKKVVQKAAKKGVKNQVVGKALTSAFSALAPYIGIAILVILIIIIIIGIVGFLITMPGIMKEKLTAFATGIGDWWDKLYKTNANVSVKDEDIVSLGNYIADMGYDLIGFGFITPKDEKHIYTYESLKDEYDEEKVDDKIRLKNKKNGSYFEDVFIYKDGHSYDGKTGEMIEYIGASENNNKKNSGNYTKYGIQYDGNGKIKSFKHVDSSLLRKYAISNARIEFIRNDDNNKNIVNLFASIFADDDPYDQWSKGLIYLYDASNYLASDSYEGLDTWFDTIELKNGGKTLSIKKGVFNNAIDFSTEGWSGRYGLSQDFLISLHLATLSPELVQTMVQTFDTEVQVYLDEIDHNAKSKAKIIDTASSVVGIPDGKDFSDDDVGLTLGNGMLSEAGIKVNDKGLDVDAWWTSQKEAARFFAITDMDSPSNCTGAYHDSLPDCYIEKTFPEYLKTTTKNYDSDSMYTPLIHYSGGTLINFPSLPDYMKGEGIMQRFADRSGLYSPSTLRSTFYEALKDYKDFGFSYDDFKANVKMYAEGDTAVVNLVDSKYLDKNTYINSLDNVYDDTYYEYYSDTSINGGRKLKIVDSNGELVDEAYEKIKKKLEDDYGEKLDNVDEIKYQVGSDCIYQFGKVCKGSGSNSDDGFFFLPASGFCRCPFCSSFYGKYVAMQAFVNGMFENAQLDDCNMQFWRRNSNIIYDEYHAIIYFYEWDYEGITYKIGLYYDKNENYGDMNVVVARGWTPAEWDEFRSKYQNAGCSANVKGEDPDDAEDEDMCNNCCNYVNDIVNSLLKVNDENFKTYVPYIARVVNSWFRDTYFIIPEESTYDYAINKAVNKFGYKKNQLAGANLPVIENDEDFLKETGELWTEYVLDTKGNYAQFFINSDGNYFSSEQDLKSFLDMKITDSEDRKKVDSFKEDSYDYSINGSTGTYYGLWKAEKDPDFQTPEEKEVNEILAKYNIATIKYPVTRTVDKLSLIGDTNNGKLAWNAYGPGSDNSKWQEITIGSSSPYCMNQMKDHYKQKVLDDGSLSELKMYTELKGVFNFVQLADAQRGMTNAKIKYMFKTRKYYKYDGSVERAYKIYNDWQQCINIFGSEEKAIDALDNLYYNNKNTSIVFARDFDGDDIADIASTSSATTNSDTGDPIKIDSEKTIITSDPRNPFLIDNIDLDLESLSAFSILENTPSADAEYAYRDLKELIVELDYFDKEDLMEPPKEVLEWLLPDAGSAGWPNRIYDKSTEYGTLIHSKDLYNALNEIDTESITQVVTPGIIQNGGPANNVANAEEIQQDNVLLGLSSSIASRAEAINNPIGIKPAVVSDAGNEPVYCLNRVVVNNVEYKCFKQYLIENETFNNGSSQASYKTDACGICSVAAMLTGYGKHDITPVDVGSKLTNYGYQLTDLQKLLTDNGGPSSTIYYMNATSKDDAVKLIRDAFSKGKPVLVNVKGQCEWSDSSGHFMVAVGEEKMSDDTYAVDLLDSGFGTAHTPQNKGARMEYKDSVSRHLNGLEDLVENYLTGKGFLIPLTAPDEAIVNIEGMDVGSVYTMKKFEGYDVGQPIVSPATAKILEIGTVTIDNETKESVMDTYYTAEDIQSADDIDAKKKLVTSAQYAAIEAAAQEKQEDAQCPFGKTYTTGYVKLEVIGQETKKKFESLSNISFASKDVYTKGINAFYEDYYNIANSKSICDSYTIYIEGIDLTGDLEDPSSGGLNADLSNTILAKLFEANNSTGDTLGNSISTEITSTLQKADKQVNGLDINYYTRKLAPKYFTPNAKIKINQKEDKKQALPSIIKLKSNSKNTTTSDEIYVKAGTVLGVTGNARIKIIMKDKKNQVVENVEEYMEIEDPFSDSNTNAIKKVNQEYDQDSDGNDVYRLAALMHHEFCADSSFIANAKVRNRSGDWVLASSLEDGQGNLNDISKTCAYVLINRALVENKLLKECITHQAYGDCADGYNSANANSGNWCAKCLENAQFCLMYDCSAVVSSEGVPMTRNCLTQSSFDVSCGSAWNQPNNLERWWCIDADGNGEVRDHCWWDGSSAMDSFFLREKDKDDLYSAQKVPDYGSSIVTH